MAKILLVEDDPMISEIYHRKLEQSGYEVDLCVDGQEALKRARANDYDLILLDLVLPSLDGVGILRELSQEGKSPLPSPVVVFSNLNDTENQEAAFSYGASGFMIKAQFDLADLPKEAERYIRQAQAQKRNETKASGGSGSSEAEPEKRVLFVEDEEVFVGLFSESLEKDGFRVAVAGTGAEAMQVLERESIDVIVTDMLLPVMRGDEFISLVRREEKFRNIPIVVISASALDEEMGRVEKLGVDGMFVKTRITPSELAGHIRKILAGRDSKQK